MGAAGRGAIEEDAGAGVAALGAAFFGAALRAVFLRAVFLRAGALRALLLRFAPRLAFAFFAVRDAAARLPFARPPFFLPDRFDFLPVRAIKPPVSGLDSCINASPCATCC
jgi:hypothetical protein